MHEPWLASLIGEGLDPSRADADGRKLSNYIERVLTAHVESKERRARNRNQVRSSEDAR